MAARKRPTKPSATRRGRRKKNAHRGRRKARAVPRGAAAERPKTQEELALEALARDPLEEKRREAARAELIESMATAASTAFPPLEVLFGKDGVKSMVDVGVSTLVRSLVDAAARRRQRGTKR